MSTTTPYPNLSLTYRKEINEATVESMKWIGKLDQATDIISELLDAKVAKILPIQDLTTCPKDVEEIQKLKKILEILSAKKLDLAVKTYDFIDVNVKAIDFEMNGIEKALIEGGVTIPIENKDGLQAESLIGKRKAAGVVEESKEESSETLKKDDSEPVYCLCKQVAYGEMIACDNEDCPIEWFHYPCVNLSRKPKNSWICPLCSNKRRK
eukprot:gene11634-12693_t